MIAELFNPKSTEELLAVIEKNKYRNFRFAAGCTDLLLELRKNPEEGLTVINLSHVEDAEFNCIKKLKAGLWIGARVTANDLIRNEEIKNNFPVLHEAALGLASTQIRQVATVGGNLCTASPSGDIACALMALEAVCEIMDSSGKKETISINGFFKSPRETVLEKNDLLFGVFIPSKNETDKKIISHFIKIGTRKSMECSVVSLAYHIKTNETGDIINAGIAIGAAAPTIVFAENAKHFLIGKNIYKISEGEKEAFASEVLSYASPISDLRATAWYRKQVLFNISKSIFENI